MDDDAIVQHFFYGTEISVYQSAFEILGNHYTRSYLEIQLFRSDAVLGVELARYRCLITPGGSLQFVEFNLVMRIDHVIIWLQVNRLGRTLALVQFLENVEVSIPYGIEYFDELRILLSLYLVQLQSLKSFVGFRFVERKGSVFLLQSFKVFLVLFRKRSVYRRQLFRIPDEYHLYPSEGKIVLQESLK